MTPTAQSASEATRSGPKVTSGRRSDPLSSVEVVVLSDSHLPRGLEGVQAQVLDAVARADVVLHAGDITSPQALAELEAMAETYAVLGNNDHGLHGILPESRLLELGGVQIAMIHDSGARTGRPRRLHRRFPDADLVVFGHSHVPVNEVGEHEQLLFNPGSPTQRRAQPHRTFGRLRLGNGKVLSRQIELL
jgi:putative phosphoesterase